MVLYNMRVFKSEFKGQLLRVKFSVPNLVACWFQGLLAERG